MARRALGVAGVALALGVGLAPAAPAGALPLPRCPGGEGNPIVFAAPARISAGTPATVRVRADLSERVDLDLVTAVGRRVRTYSTGKDLVRVSVGGLAPGDYTLRVKAAFTYPVPETGEVGLCLRVGGRMLTVRRR